MLDPVGIGHLVEKRGFCRPWGCGVAVSAERTSQPVEVTGTGSDQIKKRHDIVSAEVPFPLASTG